MRTQPDLPAAERRFASFDPESATWMRSLTSSGAENDDAIARLHALLLRVARVEARRRAHRRGIDGPELDDLAHQAASDALVAIVAKLEQFRGESRFTTWAYKFVVLEVSTKFRRHFWNAASFPMGTEEWNRLPDRFGAEAGQLSEQSELIAAVREAVTSALTIHQ